MASASKARGSRAWRALPVATRLWASAEFRDSGCIEFTGHIGNTGYGQIGSDGKLVSTHRLAYELTNGPVPDGLHVLHSCDNRACISPSHLRAGTDADNSRDAIERGRVNPRSGETHPNMKLTDEQVAEIRQQYAARKYGDVKRIAAEFGIHEAYVRDLAVGRWRVGA